MSKSRRHITKKEKKHKSVSKREHCVNEINKYFIMPKLKTRQCVTEITTPPLPVRHYAQIRNHPRGRFLCNLHNGKMTKKKPTGQALLGTLHMGTLHNNGPWKQRKFV